MSRRWVMLLIVFLTRTSMGVQFQAIAAVAPLLVADLHLSYAQVGTLSGLYMLPGAVFAVAGGVLGARFGERRMVIAGLALMAVGAVVTAVSGGFVLAAGGRLLSGVGAILMNILLARLVAGWFEGREMSTAMAVMLSSWPVGLGVAAATLGRVGTAWSWRVAVDATGLVALLGLLLMVAVYRDPAGARRDGAVVAVEALERRVATAAVVAGFAWGCFNAALVALIQFGPGLLVARGATIGDAGATVSTAVWITLVSVPVGGLVADRWKRPNLLIAGATIVAGIVATLLPASGWPLGSLLVIGLIGGAPAGAIMALLPGVVRPGALTTAFGVYYAVFYLVMALTPPVAGAIRDVTGSAAAPVVFAGLQMMTTALGLALFRVVARRVGPSAA